ncbi:PP2C family protein-serine/threonine phosphatase [Streptomyces odontomachi]|uniref:PP2C family protein-serine/threonine phosphatase n=1 Tax=Streptomyces odontomachi TaxID=2944940 RepID=UPI00210EAAC0|nr:PP2C family protein-serine/threonine phosphatase [Streptomyces sp. ODS25]
MRSRTARSDVLADLISASHVMTLEQIPDKVAEHAARGGWSPVRIYLADLQQRFLHLLPSGRASRTSVRAPIELPVEGTAAGRCFRTGAVLPAVPSPAAQWWVPLIDGTERIGTALIGESDPEPGGPVPLEDLDALAGLITLLLVSKRATSDFHARLIRRRDMKVAAEMEWRLMPPRTCAAERAFISAVMEPAYEVSGDAYDYAVAADAIDLAVYDAMGHDTAAGLTANLAVAAGRKYRRQGAGLIETAEGIERTLVEQFGGNRFATGILARLDLTDGSLDWISHGHFSPVVLHPGGTAEQLPGAPAPPMGTDLGVTAAVCRHRLGRGDLLLLYTDGITEARNRAGQEFGLERLVHFLVNQGRSGLPVPELLRSLIAHHHGYHEGKLPDDATVMMLGWNGPEPYEPHRLERLVGVTHAGYDSGR